VILVEVGTTAEVTRRKKTVVTHDGRDIVVIADAGTFHALDDVCVHKQRELHKGVVLKGRIVCPGHQWAFDLTTGYEAVKEECQPVYDVVVQDGIVFVDAASRRITVPPCATTAAATPTPVEEPSARTAEPA
jgi:nitrite reductase/ring-hydroxylating ferredoxin subunit